MIQYAFDRPRYSKPMLTPRQRQLFDLLRPAAVRVEPGGAFVLVGQRENGGDAGVAGEERAQEFGAVALAAAV